MYSRNLLARFLSPNRPHASPEVEIQPDGDGLLVLIRPDSLTREERQAIWHDVAAGIVAAIHENMPEVSARVVVPENGFEGIIQYTWPVQSNSPAEGRFVWLNIQALCPQMSERTNEAIRRRLATRVPTQSVPPRPPATRRGMRR